MTRTSITKLCDIFPRIIKNLNTVVVVIYNIHIIPRINCKLKRIVELTVACSGGSKSHQKVSAFIEFLYIVVFTKVSGIQIVFSIGSQTTRIDELTRPKTQ